MALIRFGGFDARLLMSLGGVDIAKTVRSAPLLLQPCLQPDGFAGF